MKKLISFIVCILLILTVSVPAFAAGTANVTCKVSNDVVKRGEKVTVTVSLNNSDPFKSMAITPIYDSDIFEMVSGEWLISGAMLSDFNKTSAAIAYASEVNKSGDIFTFVLKAKTNATTGNTTINVNCVIKNGNATISSKTNPDSIKVACATHSFGGWNVVGEATCTANGSEKRVCSVCGDTETRTISAKGHNMSDWTQTKAPACDIKGQEKRVCNNSNCTHSETRDIAALGHKFSGWKTTTKATCNAGGTQERICTVCDKKETRTTSPVGHDFESPVVVKEATLSSTGLVEGKCKNCGSATQEIIPCTAKDENTGISVEAEAGVFEEGTELSVTAIAEAYASYSNIKNLLASKGGKFAAYSVGFVKNNATVTPKGNYILNIPNSANIKDEDIVVCFVNSNGTVAEAEYVLEDGIISVNTSNSGIVAVVDKSVKGDVNSNVDGNTDTVSTQNEEGNNILWIIILVAVLIIIAIILLIVLKKRKHNRYIINQ